MADEDDPPSIVIRDEASDPVRRVRRQWREFQRNAKFNNVRNEFSGLASLAQRVGFEFGTSLNLMGVEAEHVRGGLVDKFSSWTTSLSGFANESRARRYASQAIGLTTKELVQFTRAATARTGFDAQDVENRIVRLGHVINEISRPGGELSKAWEQFRIVGGPEGLRVAREIRDTRLNKGMSAAIKLVFQKIRDAPGTEENRQWYKQFLVTVTGLDSAGFGAALDDVEKFGHVIELGEKETEDFLQQAILIEIQMEQLKLRIATALIPSFVKLTELLITNFSSAEAIKFRQSILDSADALEHIPWASLQSTIEAVLGFLGREIKFFMRDLVQIFSDLDSFVKLISAAMQRDPMEAETEGQQKFNRYLNYLLGGNVGAKPVGPPLSLEPPATYEEKAERLRRKFRRGPERHSELLDRRELLNTSKDVAEEIFQLADWLRIQRAGAGGGNTEGGVTRAGRNRPMATRAGGAGGAPDGALLRPWRSGDPITGMHGGKPFPTLGPEATPLPLRPGDRTFSGVSEGRGVASWFGQGRGWGDKPSMDQPGSNALRVPEHLQGISLSEPKTVGQFFYVTDPSTGLTHVRQQTDAGPGVRTQKLVDVSVAAAQREGYSKSSFEAMQGRVERGSLRPWEVTNTGFGIQGRSTRPAPTGVIPTVETQNISRIGGGRELQSGADVEFNPFQRSGGPAWSTLEGQRASIGRELNDEAETSTNMDLNVRVTGPEDTTTNVDATVSGFDESNVSADAQ